MGPESEQQERKRLAQALAALLRAHVALGKASSEHEMLQAICAALAEEAFYPLSWIGFAEDDAERTVRVVATAGVAADYTRDLKISWADDQYGDGPSGRSIRSGEPQIVDSFSRSHRMGPWRERAEQFGLQSSVFVPIRIRGQIIGSFGVYSREEAAFGSSELDLFRDFANAISIGIESRRRLAERDAAQAALVKAMQLAEAASRAKSAFLANMSHELRTPLNAVIGFAEIIAGEIVGPIGDARYRQYGADICEAARHLLQILTDVLDMSKIESGLIDFDIQDVTLRDVVLGALHLIWQQAGKKGVRVDFPREAAPFTLRSDARALKQILINLLSNAVKFTPEGGSVSIGATLQSNGDLAIEVRDTGMGIAEKDLERVFEPFEQADSGIAKSHGGSGLGLAISRRLAQELGAELTLVSALGVGTTATLKFPERLMVTQAPARHQSQAQ